MKLHNAIIDHTDGRGYAQCGNDVVVEYDIMLAGKRRHFRKTYSEPRSNTNGGPLDHIIPDSQQAYGEMVDTTCRDQIMQELARAQTKTGPREILKDHIFFDEGRRRPTQQ